MNNTELAEAIMDAASGKAWNEVSGEMADTYTYRKTVSNLAEALDKWEERIRKETRKEIEEEFRKMLLPSTVYGCHNF
jgi:uncharacterized protein YjiS (DUF1127 family)